LLFKYILGDALPPDSHRDELLPLASEHFCLGTANLMSLSKNATDNQKIALLISGADPGT